MMMTAFGAALDECGASAITCGQQQCVSSEALRLGAAWPN